jgi:hypothetical protein
VNRGEAARLFLEEGVRLLIAGRASYEINKARDRVVIPAAPLIGLFVRRK